MSRIQPSVSLSRALTAARAATYRSSFRYSSTAAPSASTSTPTPTPSSSRAADLAAVEATTESDSAQPTARDPLRPSQPSKSKHLKTASRTAKTVPFTPATEPQMPLSPPRYHVARSANRNLPIYSDYKRGGNLHLTTVRKITGDLHALREELKVWLAKKDEDVKVNALTGHVVVKGHHTGKIAEFLKGRGM